MLWVFQIYIWGGPDDTWVGDGGGGEYDFFLKKSLFGKSQEKIICLVMQGQQVCSGGKTTKNLLTCKEPDISSICSPM